MAKFQPIHGNLSGSMGGNTWSHNKGGAYLRRRSKPVNNTSARRTVVRSYLSNSSRLWAGLSDANRTAWKTYAASNPVIDSLGVTITLTGLNQYIRLNSRLADFGGSVLTTPPAAAAPVSLLSFSAAIVGSTGVATLTFTTTPVATGSRLAVWYTKSNSAGRDPNFNQAQLAGYTATAPVTGVTFTLPATFPTGAVLNLYVAVVDGSGRTSTVRKARVVVT